VELLQSATRPPATQLQPDAPQLRPDAAQVRWRLRLHAAVLFLVIAVCGRVYFHLAADEQHRLIFSHNAVTYYSQLAEAFRHGQLSLLTPPKPQLLALADPYLPALNAPYRMHDASLYGGKYYLYFGPAPVLVLHMPLRWLTGYYPSDAAAVLIFLMVPQHQPHVDPARRVGHCILQHRAVRTGAPGGL
jgi:hypothetical protein